MLTVIVKDCVIWSNYVKNLRYSFCLIRFCPAHRESRVFQAKWVGGAYRILNAWPAVITLQDSMLLDNYALIGHDFSLYNLGQNILPAGFVLQGNTTWNVIRVLSSGLHLDPAGMNGGFLGLIYTHFNAALGQTAAADANTNINIDGWTMEDITIDSFMGLFVQNFVYGTAGVFRVNVRNMVNRRQKGISTSRKHVSSAFFYSDHLTMTDTIFDDCGSDNDVTAVSEGGAIIFLPFATARLERSEFRGNKARVGGAISLTGGSGSTIIRTCVFIGNVAFGAGGAIAFKSTGNQLVLDTVFIGNEVSTSVLPPTRITVRIFTGDSGMASPGVERRDRIVWFVGAACDPCSREELPLEADGSVDHMSGRQTEVFGNTSYISSNLYTEIISLPPGRHRLYHGVIAASNQPVLGWDGDGWMDLVDLVPRTYPKFFDDRAASNPDTGVPRYPGCRLGGGDDTFPEDCPSLDRCRSLYREDGPGQYGSAGTDAGTNYFAGTTLTEEEAAAVPGCVPKGPLQYMWDHTDFEIVYGSGGAISAVGSGSIHVRDSNFVDNVAGEGSSIQIVSIPTLETTNVSFTDAQPFVVYGGSVVHDCVSLPCQAGSACTYRQWSRFCISCGVNEIGDGTTCTSCQPVCANWRPSSTQFHAVSPCFAALH